MTGKRAPLQTSARLNFGGKKRAADPCPASCQAKRGFSLLEVMIALAIAGIALVSLLSLGTRSIGVHERLQRITQATLLAQQKMAETEASVQISRQDLNADEGIFDDPFSMYNWRLEYSETPLPSVRMITVTVVWGDEDKNEAVAIDSFVF